MKHINDLPPEALKVFWKLFKSEFCDQEYPFLKNHEAELFFLAGYEAAIAERAKVDEQRIDNWARMVLKDRQKRNKRK